MSVAIVGTGISGLLTAIELKLLQSGIDVALVDNGQTSNSALAGHRYRKRMSGSAELQDLFEWYGGKGVLTERTLEFFATGRRQLSFWRSFDPATEGLDLPRLPSRDADAWFGPQLGETTKAGRGKGGSVMKWLAALARGLGIRMLECSVHDIEVADGLVSLLIGRSPAGRGLAISASHYVFAGGSPGGSMFESTNVENWDSLLPMFHARGVPIADADLFMLHMAANCGSEGHAKHGCHETDLLAGSIAYLQDADGKFTVADAEITDLLARHKGHEQMPEVCQKIIRHGGLVRYAYPDHDIIARVSHHYSHLRLETEDGTRVRGLGNAYVVGDMAGLGYWLGRHVRLPGTALTGCLVSASACAARLVSARSSDRVITQAHAGSTRLPAEAESTRRKMRKVNTLGLFAYMTGELEATAGWVTELQTDLEASEPWVRLSTSVARACYASLAARATTSNSAISRTAHAVAQ